MELIKFDDKAFNIYILYKGQKGIVLKNCFCSETYERFIVYGRKATITIQNNRPELRRLDKNNHKLDWKMIVGPADIPVDFLKAVFNAMDSYIENIIEGGAAAGQDYQRKKKRW